MTEVSVNISFMLTENFMKIRFAFISIILAIIFILIPLFRPNEDFIEFWENLNRPKDFFFNIQTSYSIQLGLIILIGLGAYKENYSSGLEYFLFLAYWILIVVSAWLLGRNLNLSRASGVLGAAAIVALVAAFISIYEYNYMLGLVYIIASVISLQASWSLSQLNKFNF